MDLSIVIPHRGNTLGLWATVHSCEEDLRNSKLDYEFVLVTNGAPLLADDLQLIHAMKEGGRLRAHHHTDLPLTPPNARQIGADLCSGKVLFFFDNHCLLARDYFSRAIHDFDNEDIDVLHSTTCFYTSTGMHYHYLLNLEYNFWGSSQMLPQDEYRPYQIAAGGHGGFAVRRSVFNDVGGYGPSELLTGYGGEEMIFDLKMWRLGYKVWLDPKVIHYHFAGNRGYARHYTDDYYTNILTAANVIGGAKWLDTLSRSLLFKHHTRMSPKKTVYDLLKDAKNKSAQYAAELDAQSKYSLDELLVMFRRNGIAT
jgi:hypothetical protein